MDFTPDPPPRPAPWPASSSSPPLKPPHQPTSVDAPADDFAAYELLPEEPLPGEGGIIDAEMIDDGEAVAGVEPPWPAFAVAPLAQSRHSHFQPQTYDGTSPSKRRWPLILALAIGVPVAGIALFFGLGFLFLATASDVPIGEQDLAVLVRAEHAAEYIDGAQVLDRYAKTTKVRYVDGSHELSYEYDAPDGTKPVLYLKCTVEVEASVSDARSTYMMGDVADRAGLKIGGGSELTIVERNDLYRWGEQSSHSLIRSNGYDVGHLFRARAGKTIFSLMLIGLHFDDHDALDELLGPRLERLKLYRP